MADQQTSILDELALVHRPPIGKSPTSTTIVDRGSQQQTPRSITLDVGGRQFKTTVQTLTGVPDTYFARFFSSNWSPPPPSDGGNGATTIFIDRNGEMFAYILSYLRNGAKIELPKDRNQLLDLKHEADYYAVGDLVNLIDERLHDPSRVMIVNVGGVLHNITASTLRNAPTNSPLWKLASDEGPISEDEQGRIFIDRDGTLFAFVLEYLRTGQIIDRRHELTDRSTWQRLEKEAAYYQLTGMVDALLNKTYPMRRAYQAQKQERLDRKKQKEELREARLAHMQEKRRQEEEALQEEMEVAAVEQAEVDEQPSPRFSFALACPPINFL